MCRHPISGKFTQPNDGRTRSNGAFCFGVRLSQARDSRDSVTMAAEREPPTEKQSPEILLGPSVPSLDRRDHGWPETSGIKTTQRTPNVVWYPSKKKNALPYLLVAPTQFESQATLADQSHRNVASCDPLRKFSMDYCADPTILEIHDDSEFPTRRLCLFKSIGSHCEALSTCDGTDLEDTPTWRSIPLESSKITEKLAKPLYPRRISQEQQRKLNF